MISASSSHLKQVPIPGREAGFKALAGIWRRGSVMGALEVFHREMGDVFRIGLPVFNPVVLVGTEACHFLLVTARDEMRWRIDGEPITRLLRHGVLVEDAESHDDIRRAMNPALHKRMLERYTGAMVRSTDTIIDQWQAGNSRDMLVEMRKIAMLVLTDALFGVDFTPEMARLWRGVLRAVQYISPGLWVIFPWLSKWGYDRHIRQIEHYLYTIIRFRRENPGEEGDLLSTLIQSGMNDELIRDQLMTMLIAGHDTSTANLAWTLYLLGNHPDVMAQSQAEIQRVMGDALPSIEHVPQLGYLGQVINESLRMYPPIHLGSRVALTDIEFNGYQIPAGRRVLYSIYLTHRHPEYWENPDQFDPSRFAPGVKHAPYTFLPFGGGPRNCIGAAFAQVEAKIVLARILQRFDLTLQNNNVRPYMGATLEPRPGVQMLIRPRTEKQV